MCSPAEVTESSAQPETKEGHGGISAYAQTITTATLEQYCFDQLARACAALLCDDAASKRSLEHVMRPCGRAHAAQLLQQSHSTQQGVFNMGLPWPPCSIDKNYNQHTAEAPWPLLRSA